MNLTDLRKSLENYPLVSELKSLFAAHTNAEEWEKNAAAICPDFR